jgi:hypothetical protein
MGLGLLTALVTTSGLGASLLGLVASPAQEATRWRPGAPITVWIERERVPPRYVEMVRRALGTWERAASRTIRFEEVAEFPPRGIRVHFAAGDSTFGEAAPSLDRDGRIVRVEVVLSIDTPGDALQKQLVLYLTALHEIGHALGLTHTDDFDTIMYRFRRPSDPSRYFLRYRRTIGSAEDIGSPRASGLHARDLRALRRLYGGN